jgi:hypothetical protein
VDDLITGVIGLVLISAFLGFYFIGIGSVPFGIIVIGIFVLLVVEFWEGFRKENH